MFYPSILQLQMPNLQQTTPGPTLLAALNVDPRLAHGQTSQSLGIPQMGLLSKKAEDQAVLPVNLIVSQSSSTSLPLSMRSSIPQYPRQAQCEMTSANLSTSSMRTVQPFTGVPITVQFILTFDLTSALSLA